MNKPYTTIAVVFLEALALLQLIRFLLAWPVSVNGLVIPVWISAVAFVILTTLSVLVWRERR